MKHQSEGLNQILEHELDGLIPGIGDGERAAMIQYLLAVLEANQRVNLTSIREPNCALRLHLVDSLTALRELARAPEGEAVDLGSGGGFPGVPLSIVSGRRFTLLDSVAKKGSALEAILREVGGHGLKIDVASLRAEDFAREYRGRYAAVVVRAVGPLASLVELASPLLVHGGMLIALKGRPDPTERQSGAAVAAMVGMSECSCRELTLPGGEEHRTIVTYVKNATASIELPRRTGLAQHEPLG